MITIESSSGAIARALVPVSFGHYPALWQELHPIASLINEGNGRMVAYYMPPLPASKFSGGMPQHVDGIVEKVLLQRGVKIDGETQMPDFGVNRLSQGIRSLTQGHLKHMAGQTHISHCKLGGYERIPQTTTVLYWTDVDGFSNGDPTPGSPHHVGTLGLRAVSMPRTASNLSRSLPDSFASTTGFPVMAPYTLDNTGPADIITTLRRWNEHSSGFRDYSPLDTLTSRILTLSYAELPVSAVESLGLPQEGEIFLDIDVVVEYTARRYTETNTFLGVVLSGEYKFQIAFHDRFYIGFAGGPFASQAIVHDGIGLRSTGVTLIPRSRMVIIPLSTWGEPTRFSYCSASSNEFEDSISDVKFKIASYGVVSSYTGGYNDSRWRYHNSSTVTANVNESLSWIKSRTAQEDRWSATSPAIELLLGNMANNLETLNELRDISSALPDIGHLVRLFGFIRQNKLAAIKSFAELCTGTYLYNVFGLQPNLETLRMMPDFVRLAQRVSLIQRSHGSYVRNPTATTSWRTNCLIQLDEAAKFDFIFITALNLYAAGLLPTPGTMWDLRPMSFVVDWFVNIGEKIRAFEHTAIVAGLPIQRVVITHKFRRYFASTPGNVLYFQRFERRISAVTPFPAFGQETNVPFATAGVLLLHLGLGAV